jgi:hypothetical protein
MTRWQEGVEERERQAEDAVVEQLAAALAARGLRVDRSIGQSHFRCDLAVYRDGDEEYLYGSRHLPEASQNASPNLIPGTAVTSASWMSSTDLMKCVRPRMKLISSGFSILTVVNCTAVCPSEVRHPGQSSK